MIDKSGCGQTTIDYIKANKSIYLTAVGGASYLISKSIKKAKFVAFEDLGIEVIYEFKIKDILVTVAADSLRESAHQQGPKLWKARIKDVKIKVQIWSFDKQFFFLQKYSVWYQLLEFLSSQ